MLTSVARAALRRVLTRATAPTTSNVTRVLPIRSSFQIRSFTSSEPTWEAAQVPTSKGAKKTTVAKKTPAKKAAAKKKVAAKKPKKKVVAKKKKAPVKPKKVLTPEEKEADKVKLLKKMSLLSQPKSLPVSPWLLFTQSQKQQPSSEGQKAMARAYHDLSATEMADLRATAEANKTVNHSQHLEWVESYPPETILLANLSRRELSRKTGKKISPIQDARLPNNIRSGFNFYMTDRLAGRGKDSQRFSDVASAWKVLSPEDKRPFNEMAEAEKTLVTRQRAEVMAKVKELKKTIREEYKTKSATGSGSRKTKVTATNELGL